MNSSVYLRRGIVKRWGGLMGVSSAVAVVLFVQLTWAAPAVVQPLAAGPPDAGRSESIERIADLMGQAQQRLADGDLTAEMVQLQDQIVRRLQELASETSEGRSAATGAEAGGAPSPADPGEPVPNGFGGEADQPDAAGGTEYAAGLPEFWGKLPQRERERLEGAFPERFLPEYEEAIRAYFRRLAEDPLLYDR